MAGSSIEASQYDLDISGSIRLSALNVFATAWPYRADLIHSNLWWRQTFGIVWPLSAVTEVVGSRAVCTLLTGALAGGKRCFVLFPVLFGVRSQ